MKQADIIRLGIIAMALLLAYNGIIRLIEFVDFFIALIISSYHGELDLLSNCLKLFCFFTGSYLLIRHSRKISGFIDQQK